MGWGARVRKPRWCRKCGQLQMTAMELVVHWLTCGPRQ